MKGTFIFIAIILLSATAYFQGEYIGQKKCPTIAQKLSADSTLILETVHNDQLLQKYILSPTYRERVREAVEEFDKKYPK